MFDLRLDNNFGKPVQWFFIGWCLVLLVPILPLMPAIQTFIHPWRPELAASIVFLTTLAYLLYRHWNKTLSLNFSRREINFIILPLLMFIMWSGLSIAWSSSSGSAFYHTLAWAEYLIFYIVIRQIIERRNGFKASFIPLTLTLLIIVLPPIFEYFPFLASDWGTTLGIRYAKYGELVNTIFPLLTVLVLRLRGKPFVFGLLTVSALWFFIISTLGRTNLIIFVCGLTVITVAVFVFKHLHKYRRRMAKILLAVIIIPLPFHSITFLATEPNVPLIKRYDDHKSIGYSSNVRELLKSVSLEMFLTHPIKGVGADNFGMQFNEYRVAYAAKNPTDMNLMTAENEIAERSHNEYLQILAELGTVGGLIFLWFLSGIALMILAAVKRSSRISLLPSASLLGILFFLASSLVSSYSFRLVQNGFVFFFVLAVAAKFFLKPHSAEAGCETVTISNRQLKFGYTLGIAACLLLTTHCLMRAASSYYSNKAQSQADIEQALPDYQTAFWLDGENPNAHFAYGMNLLKAQRYAEATVQFRKTIQAQRATSTDYSYLATAQTLSGDTEGAERTFAEALRLYPHSPFVLTRYAALLQSRGETEDSAKLLQIALNINKPEANTWWVMLTRGAREASLVAAGNKDFVPVYSLMPQPAIDAVVFEREIKYPNERFSLKLSD